MEKKINNPFDYSDYRVLLGADFSARSIQNTSYSLRAYARDLGLSSGFLSNVLRGQKNLGIVSCTNVFSKLGFRDNELLYIEKLVISKCSVDQVERENAFAYIQQHYNRLSTLNKPSKDAVLKTVEHFIVYGIIREVSDIKKIYSIANHLSISVEKLEEVLSDFLAINYIRRSDDEMFVVDEKLVIVDHERVPLIMSEYSRLLLHVIKKNGIIGTDNATHGLFLGLDEASLGQCISSHQNFIKQLVRLGQSTKNPSRFVFYTDAFLAIDPTQMNDN